MSARDGARPTRFPLALSRVQPDQATSASTSREVLRPQRLLDAAARDASRAVTPSGFGLDSSGVRKRMVDRLRSEVPAAEQVWNAFAQIPRHLFVDTALAPQAYEDTSLPIGHGQTISKPSVVARMLALLFEGERAQRLGHLGRVLEIGTGCGYQAALLSRLSMAVVSIERLAALHERAAANLAQPGLDQSDSARMHLIHGDGMLGAPMQGPFQSIIAAAGGDALPPAWLHQLAPGGRLVAPTRLPGHDHQVLTVVDKHADGSVHHRSLDGVLFVPLKSGTV